MAVATTDDSYSIFNNRTTGDIHQRHPKRLPLRCTPLGRGLQRRQRLDDSPPTDLVCARRATPRATPKTGLCHYLRHPRRNPRDCGLHHKHPGENRTNRQTDGNAVPNRYGETENGRDVLGEPHRQGIRLHRTNKVSLVHRPHEDSARKPIHT